MIEFEALAIKINTNELHAIFLLKKNIQSNIIKIILRYLPIAALKTLKEQKITIISVGQGYKPMEGQYDYKTGTRTTYRERGQPMDIRKSNNNFKDRKLKCFSCNKYGYIAKKYQKKKKKETRKCFKCNKERHIAKDCKEKQLMKKQKVQKESDNEKEDNKKKGFGKDLKQAWYKRSLL